MGEVDISFTVTQERRLWKMENSSDFREDAKVLGEPHSGIGIILSKPSW